MAKKYGDYVDERDPVWMIETRERKPQRKSFWSTAWHPTGLTWYITRVAARNDIEKRFRFNARNEYRVRRYVRKDFNV